MQTPELGIRVYVGHEDGVTALNGTTGQPIWTYGPGLFTNIHGIVVERVVGAGPVPDVRIYAATEFGFVHCIKDSGTSASHVWDTHIGDPRFYSCSSLTLAGGKVMFVASDVDPCLNIDGSIGLVALKRGNGDLLYFTPIRSVSDQDPFDDFDPVAPPSVDETTGRVYLENHAFSLASGALLWTSAGVVSPYRWQHNVVDIQNDRVLMSDGGTIYSVQGSNGVVVWQTSYQADCAPVVANGKVFIGDGATLRAVNAASGVQAWQVSGLVSVERLLAANADANNPVARIWACDFNGPGSPTTRITCMRQTDGGVLGTPMTGGDSANWTPALGTDGIYNTACCGGVLTNSVVMKFQ